ncbi:hypothetical protein HM1_1230 [Heliomicrobium modesticaldum Ice1]|uniref:Haloacid dehalogenase-like hydrolase n=1 Tax=Heliobacterium modesticaldum (strain ATCC 51547 / Ice1) TaxID=498761 RepID=B0TH21_HELMI|nr:hypothetical protein [Heliomicrobium modesticaldum]ABZ83346.1 hypothetical protein HM1_1230 [Heliomicrobium modesticaldum Ice1]
MNQQGRELWRDDRFLAAYAGKIEKARLISLDVFDTLLLRTCRNPDDVFVRTAEAAHAAGCLCRRITPEMYRQLRKLAEQEARDGQQRRSGAREISLDQIYATLPEDIGDRKAIAAIELAAEKSSCYLNLSVFSLIRHCGEAGVPVALLSDMYLSAEQIMALLEANGLESRWIAKLFVSSEEGVGKGSGELFERLCALYPSIDRREILHMGDNLAADVHGAAKAGIDAVHYRAITPELNSIYEWESILHGDILPELLSLRKLTDALTAPCREEEAFWFRLGAGVMGPFFTLFTEWIVDLCREEQIAGVLPLMREGSFLSRLLRETFAYHGLSIPVIPLYVSRQSTYFPGLQAFDETEIQKLFERRNVTVGDILSMFPLEPAEVEGFASYLDLEASCCRQTVMADGVNVEQALSDLLTRPPVLTKIRSFIARQRQLLARYVSGLLPAEGKVATVDLGFRGSIQSSLESALALENCPADLCHLLAMGTEAVTPHLLKGMDIRGFAGNAGENADLMTPIARSPQTIEELLMEGVGSTLGYEESPQGQVYPVLSEYRCSAEEQLQKDACQRGMLAFQQMWFKLCAQKPDIRNKALTKKRDILAILRVCLKTPSREGKKQDVFIWKLVEFKGNSTLRVEGYRYKDCL